jgi:hypothetical protein
MKKLLLLLLLPVLSFGQEDNTNLKFSSEKEIREYFDNNIPLNM